MDAPTQPMTRTAILDALRRGPRRIDAHTHVGIDPANYRRGDFPYAQSAEDLLVRLDRWGVDAAVCFPFLYTSYLDLRAFLDGRMRKARDGACAAPYVLENARLCEDIYEAYPACAGRLLPFAFFDPSRQAAAQVAALRDLATRFPLFGIKTATSYLKAPITDLLGRGACLLDFMAATGWPCMLHTAVRPDDPWADVFAILKVVRARPDVRFCLAHTCRFDRRALDAAAEAPNAFVDVSAFHIHCDLALQDNASVAAAAYRFPGDYRRPGEVMAALAETYPDTMLWGTDSPYYCFMSRFTDVSGVTHISKLRCDTDAEIATFRQLAPAVQTRMAHTNVLRFLDGRS